MAPKGEAQETDQVEIDLVSAKLESERGHADTARTKITDLLREAGQQTIPTGLPMHTAHLANWTYAWETSKQHKNISLVWSSPSIFSAILG